MQNIWLVECKIYLHILRYLYGKGRSPFYPKENNIGLYQYHVNNMPVK